MIKLMLNLHKFNNYAFFCPVSRLHLTVSSPVGFANEVTPAILKALKVKTILDVDGVVDIEAGTVKVKQAAPATKAKEPVHEEAPEPKSAEPNEDVEKVNIENEDVEKTEEKQVKKNSGKNLQKQMQKIQKADAE